MQQYEKDHLALVLDNAAECTVLLKSNGKFPIDGPCKIAAYGSGIRYAIKGGTGSGEVNSRFTYTIEEGLEKEEDCCSEAEYEWQREECAGAP